MGLLGTKASFQLMSECDTLLMVGSSFPYSEYLPKEGKARGVQIDIDPIMLGLRYPMECALVGDAATTLRALLDRLEPKAGRLAPMGRRGGAYLVGGGGTASLSGRRASQSRALLLGSLPAPARRCAALGRYRHVHDLARAVRTRPGTPLAISGSLATMGPALSYATAGKFAFPQRPAVALVGDGAMQMLGINGLITVAKYWREWADPRFIVAVLNNGDFNMVTWELRALGGAPKLPQTQDVPAFDYAGYARWLGLEGLTIGGPGDVVPTIDRAVQCRRPVVIDVRADPNVIALPPHTTMEQTKNFFAAMAKGDPDRYEVLKQLTKQLAL